jgi:hypothetical protein
MNDEGRGMNGGHPRRFHALFGALEDGWGGVHDVFSTLMSIAFLPAVPRFIPDHAIEQ